MPTQPQRSYTSLAQSLAYRFQTGLPRRIKTALGSVAGLVAVVVLVRLLSVPSSPSHGPHPYSLPGKLTYDSHNPFTTHYSPQDQPSVRPPRLMEKLVQRTRGQEKAVADAIAIASATRGRPPTDTNDHDRSHTDADTDTDDFEWLRGRTIVLLGDSLDRYHALHTCQFLTPHSPLVPLAWPYDGTPDGVRTFVDIHPPSSPAYPAGLRQLEDELAAAHRDGKPFSTDTFRPWTCRIDEFDAVIVWFFIGGLDDGKTTPGVQVYGDEQTEITEGELVGHEGTWGERAREMPFGDRAYFSVDSEHFNPPLRPEDRVRELVLPFLANIGRPTVDMVELGLGAWDAMMFKVSHVLRRSSLRLLSVWSDQVVPVPLPQTQDRMSVANHIASLPPDTDPVPDLAALSASLASQPLSPPRLGWYSDRLDAFLTSLVDVFPPTPVSRRSSSYLPRLSVRMEVVPPQHYSWPWLTAENRVRQIELEAKRVVSRLNARVGAEGRWSGGEAVRFSDWAQLVELAPGNGEWLDHVHRTFPSCRSYRRRIGAADLSV